jgi:hypothetical protein
MSLRSPAIARRSIPRGAVLALVLTSGAAAVSAQAPDVSIEPAGPLPAGSVTLTVSGIGFEPAGNGIYVVFGPVTPAPGYYLDPSIYGSFKWIHAGANESPAEAPLAADGSFGTTLEVVSTFATPAGEVDCAITACAVITFAAHGSPDRSQDTCTAVSFAAAATSPAPIASAVPSPVSPGPQGSADPVGSGSPPADDPCAPITGDAAAP